MEKIAVAERCSLNVDAFQAKVVCDGDEPLILERRRQRPDTENGKESFRDLLAGHRAL